MLGGKFLKLGLFNAGSLATGHDEFLLTMNKHSADIIAINETWLRPGEDGRAPSVPNYRLKHVPRPATVRGGRGGGVAFYIRTGIAARIKPHPEYPDIEQLWMTMNIRSKRLLIGTAYRPPWLDLDRFLDALTDSLNALAPYDYVILLGDFNVNLLHENDSKSKRLKEFLNYCSLDQVVNGPTHFLNESCSLIDIICTDARYRNISIDCNSELGHHSFVTCELIFRKDRPAKRLVIYRPLRDIAFDNFESDLQSIPWEYICNVQCVTTMVSLLSNYLLDLFNAHAPIKQRSFKCLPTPWITDVIKLMCRIRDEARDRYRCSKSLSHKEYYLQLKHQVVTALHNEKKAYFTKHMNENLSNSRALWKNLKQHVYPTTLDNMLPQQLSDPDVINNAFLDVPGGRPATISELTYFEFHRHGTSTFSLKVVDQNTILKIIKSISTNARGVDGINKEMIDLTLPWSLATITAIVNRSIITNTFPEPWLCAIVRPLPKTSNLNLHNFSYAMFLFTVLWIH